MIYVFNPQGSIHLDRLVFVEKMLVGSSARVCAGELCPCANSPTAVLSLGNFESAETRVGLGSYLVERLCRMYYEPQNHEEGNFDLLYGSGFCLSFRQEEEAA